MARKERLTEPFIKALPLPTTHHALYPDSEERGLAVRITQTGAKSFLFCYRFDGRERRLSLGPWTPPLSNRLGSPTTRKADGSLDWARREAKRLRVLVQSGTDPMEQKQAEREERETARQQAAREITFETLATRYIDEWARPNKRSWSEDERRLNAFVLPAWDRRKVKDITRADVSALVSPVATGQTPRKAEANARLALVRKVFSFALDQGIIDNHPCLRMKAPGGKIAARKRALTTAQEMRVFWRITELGSVWTINSTKKRHIAALRKRRFMEAEADALRLLLLTGARASEVTDMPWSEVDLDGAIWLLPAERSKNKRDHLVPLVPAAVELLRRRHETTNSEYVFPTSTGTHIVDKSLSRPLKQVMLRFAAYGVGVSPLTPHALRRTVETGMAASRVPKEYRDRVLNHVDGSVGGVHYNQYDFLDEKRDALEKWVRRLEGMLTDTVATVVPISAGKR